MVTEDGENVQRAETVGLKRKLTGPPRLLLGKTRTMSVGEDRPEAWTKKDGDETTELTGSPNMEEVLSEVNTETSRGRRDTGEENDIRHRKVNRRRWWRRFSSVVVCIRRQKKNMEESSEKQQNQETDAGGQDSQRVSKERTRFNVKLRTSSDVRTHVQRNEADEPSLTLQKRLKGFFSKGARSRSSGLSRENVEDMMRTEEAPCSDEPQSDSTNWSPEAAARSPEGSPSEVTEEDLTAGGSETVQTDRQVDEVAADAHEVPAEDFIEVFSTEVVLDLDDHLSACAVSSEENMNQTASRILQPSGNGPSIRIELVPPDNSTLEDEEVEEGGREGSSFSENQSLLLLLGFDRSDRQLLQTARSLVRAAVNAAMDQLTRERQSSSDCVHRDPQGCRDHA